uniref:Kelch-like family member 38b n=1 Tax=Cyprinus carpio TaxID=7962 RepID=A0A8C2ECE4_CYPCA
LDDSFLETQKPQINLQGVPYDILSSVMEYVYTGSISITMELVLPLMQAASRLQYGRLFEACSRQLSEILHCSSLREKARELAVKSFSDVVVSKNFCELLLPELVSYLEDDRLCVEEEKIFNIATLLALIHHDPFSRRGTIHDLFCCVRLRHVHPSYLFQFIANNPLPTWATPWCQNCKEAVVVVGGYKNGERTSHELLAKVPLRLYRPANVCMHSIFYVLGGLTMRAGGQCTPSSTIYTLSLKTNQWRMGEPMLTPRYTHQSSTYLHFIFVLGGLMADGQLSNEVERYDTMFNQWEAMAPMPIAVLHPAVAVHNQRICVFGGEDAMQKPIRMIQVYHIRRNLWCRMETRTVKNVCAPAAVIDDKIYIVGAFDFKTNRFEKCENMKARKMHHSATVVNDKIYVTGGRFINSHESVEDSDSFDCYDPTTDSWASVGTLPFKLFDHGSVPLVYLSDKLLPT